MTALEQKILDVIYAEGGRFHRPDGWAIDCLAQHLPGARIDDVVKHVKALAAAGRIRVTLGGRSNTTSLLEVIA